MKIIDLLNMRARNEEMPKIINYYGDFYKYDEENGFYYDSDGYSLYRQFCEFGNCLNDIVEIIESELTVNKQIDKLCYQQLRARDVADFITTLNEQLSNHGKKINELVDKVNELSLKG